MNIECEKEKMIFEADNAVTYFPYEIETHEQKRQYRAKMARRWDKAMRKLDKDFKENKKKMLKTLQ